MRAALILALAGMVVATGCDKAPSIFREEEKVDPVEVAIKEVKTKFPPPKKELAERAQIATYCKLRKWRGGSRRNHVKVLRGVIRPKCRIAFRQAGVKPTRKRLNGCVTGVLNSGVLCRGR